MDILPLLLPNQRDSLFTFLPAAEVGRVVEVKGRSRGPKGRKRNSSLTFLPAAEEAEKKGGLATPLF
jgi:hypothetical protein